MTPEELTAAEKLAEAATPGPWYWVNASVVSPSGKRSVFMLRSSTRHYTYNNLDCTLVQHESWYTAPSEEDMDFIAAARTLVPQLLNEIKQLQEEVQGMRRTLGEQP